MPSLPPPDQLVAKVGSTLKTVDTLRRAGILHPGRPDRLLSSALALLRFGATPAAGYAASALRYPDEPAVIDELGTLTFREVDERSNALAHALREDGIEEGDSV